MIGDEGELEVGCTPGDEADEQSGDAAVSVVKRMNTEKTFEETGATTGDVFTCEVWKKVLIGQITLKKAGEFIFDLGGIEALAWLTIDAATAVFDTGLTGLPKSACKSEAGWSKDPAVNALDERREFVGLGG